MKRIRPCLLLASLLAMTGCGSAGRDADLAARPESPASAEDGVFEGPTEEAAEAAAEAAAEEGAEEAAEEAPWARVGEPGAAGGEERPPRAAPIAPPSLADRPTEGGGQARLRRLPPAEAAPAPKLAPRPPASAPRPRRSTSPFRMSLQPEEGSSGGGPRIPGFFGPLPGRTELAPRLAEPAAREPLEAAAPPPREPVFRREAMEAAAPPPREPAFRRETMEAAAPPLPAARESEPAARDVAAAPTSRDPSSDEDHSLVRVFYATDRNRLTPEPTGGESLSRLGPPAAVAAVALLLGLAGWLGMRRRLSWTLAAAGLVVAGLLTARVATTTLQRGRAAGPTGVVYGNERGTLEYGVCDVSIPKRHEVGELEAPSILRLELRPDAAKHVLVQEVIPRDGEEFFGELRDLVGRSPNRDVFVFVHGFNVTFEKAARRTAQMTYDLKFEGAPIFYSWPSQGGLLGYTVDETNAAWTVPHLKQFLLDVVHRSDADAVNLIAHSMGNRALTAALRELSLELREEASLFNQIILAAPDIDAEVFRRDIAPAIVQTGKRVTLYASSDDEALAASKQVHGYARAGDSGPDLVVVPGIDTIDVSGIDTSLLGHSYYGGSGSILNDLYSVIHDALPASQRHWLHPVFRDGLTYWVFQASNLTSGRPEDDPTR